MKLSELYRLSRLDNSYNSRASQLLEQAHWFAVNAEFDPKTGEALPQALSAFLAKVALQRKDGTIQDRLHRITEHARQSVERLLRTLNESPRRDHALLHVHAVRELDANSFIKLSNRPGRNIREKLAGKPYLQAVRRCQSVNLPENRLLKAFVIRLAELLELRRDILDEAEDDLIPRIHSWLRGDEARAIARWENLPPNNTLLAHRDYRRVWDSWRRLQTLDEDIAQDLSRLDERQQTMTRWLDFGRIYHEGTHLFAEMPVMFDYETYSIRTWYPELLVEKAPQKLSRNIGKVVFKNPACIDLSEMRPRFAVCERESDVLTDAYVWQQWKNASEPVDITLFESDAAWLHPDSVTITLHELFFVADKTADHLEHAARAFATRLRDTFENDKLIWLVPDSVNDFDLTVIRRNLNARFPGAEPLPRSVAAVFDQVDYASITMDGYPVVVVDILGGITCATKLIARFDVGLKKRMPETRGYYWERCPSVILSERDAGEKLLYDMDTVSGNGKWNKSATPERPQFIDANHLKADPRIGSFESCINLIDSPVAGGVRLQVMQIRAGDTPLWRDKIPELSIKGYVNGFYRRFYLVNKNTPPVRPVRGKAVRLDIGAKFPLPLGMEHYSNPLYRGAGTEEMGFYLRLDSPAFPLKANKKCKLILTYRYGDNEPYELVFFDPSDESFPPIRATWQRTVEEIVTDAKGPDYPPSLTWSDLQRMPVPDSTDTRDHLDWVVSAIDHLGFNLFVSPRPRIVGTLATEWLINSKGENYSLAECEETNVRVYIGERSFLDGVDHLSFEDGDQLSFELRERDGNYFGWKVAHPDYKEKTGLRQFDENAVESLIMSIRKGLYVPIIQVWRDGRSITDMDCPKQFATTAAKRITCLASHALQNALPTSVKKEILFLLSCLHKDTSDECVTWVSDQVENGRIHDPQAIGFALGDVSQDWQKYIFNNLASHPDNAAVSVFAYAIWRERHFVELFSLSELKAILKSLMQRIENIRMLSIAKSGKNDKWATRKWGRTAAEPLELLLGLLRTRYSVDPKIRMLLQPHQKLTKQFAGQIDRIEEIIAESNIKLFSRVQIDVRKQKPEGVRTPDLLYALRLYLTGDDGAKAIHITGVSDRDD